jgi:hypothetical protein
MLVPLTSPIDSWFFLSGQARARESGQVAGLNQSMAEQDEEIRGVLRDAAAVHNLVCVFVHWDSARVFTTTSSHWSSLLLVAVGVQELERVQSTHRGTLSELERKRKEADVSFCASRGSIMHG